MKFGPTPIAQAQGAILAHGVSAGELVMKKGRLLSAADIDALADAGVGEVWAARLDEGDISENDAARRVAAAIARSSIAEPSIAEPGSASGYIEITAPFTGRVNLIATAAGLVLVDKARLAALNSLDEGLTVATLPPFERCVAGQLLATIKIIPFALPQAVVAAAEVLAGGTEPLAPVIQFTPFREHAAGLILTRVDSTKSSMLVKREAAVRDRLLALGSELASVITVAHEQAAIADAIAQQVASGCDPILIFGASAIVDRSDVIPTGLQQAGGRVIHLGMPVDPGNLLMLGEIGQDGPAEAATGQGRNGRRRVIGVPSCASSPKLNGFDWVLQRCLAGLAVGGADIVSMAAGGLLKEIPSRPQPRAARLLEAAGAHALEPVADKNSARQAPRIAAIVLAAGRSTRMGANKLMADLSGRPVLAHSVAAVLQSRARPVIVVTGHDRDAVASVVAGSDIQIVHNPHYGEGLSTSLAAGLAALPAGLDGALVCLGDMPVIKPHHLERLMAAFAPKEGRGICVPVVAGKRGNPVLWSAEFFSEMMAVEGDTGARHLIGVNAERVCEVEMNDAGVLVDVDTPEALQALRESEALRASEALRSLTGQGLKYDDDEDEK